MATSLRIIHPQTMPPFSGIENGRSTGLVVEIIATAAARAGYATDFIAVPFERVENELIDDVAHLAIPIAATPERQQRLDFSEPLILTGGSLYVRAPEPTPPSLKALSGKIVVTPRTGPLAASIARMAPSIQLVVTRDYEESLAMLIEGKAEAAALNHQTGAMMVTRLYPSRITIPREMFLTLPLVAAAVKGRHSDKIAALNEGLRAIKADGTHDRLCQP